MKKLLFIINPKAGKSAIKDDIFSIILVLSGAGYEVVTYPTTGPFDAERKIIADGADYDLIVCAGGDGTLENTVSGYMQMGKKVPLGYIPVGSTNDYARTLHIPRKPVEAANDIVNGTKKLVDVGQFEDKYFIYVAAFGVFTEVSYKTKQSLKKVLGHSAYVFEGIKDLAHIKTYHIKASFDGNEMSGDFILGMITNSRSVGGFKLRGAKDVVLDDGKFDCLFLRKPQKASDIPKILTDALVNHIKDDDKYFMTKASEIHIESTEIIPWTLDGEFGGEAKEATIVNHQKALEIVLNGEADLEEVEDSKD